MEQIMNENKPQVLPLHLPSDLTGLINLSGNRAITDAGDGPLFHEMLHKWAREEMTGQAADQFCSSVTQESLLEKHQSGENDFSYTYHPPEKEGAERTLTIRFLTDQGSGDVLCVCSLCERALDSSDLDTLRNQRAQSFLDSICQSYDSVCLFSLERAKISSSNILHDRLLFFPLHDAETTDYDTWITQCSSSMVLGPWQTEYETLFSLEHLRTEAQKEHAMVSFLFHASMGTLRQDVFFCRIEEDLHCMIGILNIQEKSGNVLVSFQPPESAAERESADLEMELSFERKEMKSRSRRKSLICFVLALIVGLAGAPLLDRYVPFYQSIQERIFPSGDTPPEEASSAEENKSAEETAESETVRVFVPREDAWAFSAETYENGTPRTIASSAEYDQENLTIQIQDVLTPDDFAQKYSRYVLDGTEAGISFTLSFDAIADEDISLIPQDAFQIYVAGADGQRTEEYQLMDQAAGGAYNVSLRDGNKKTFYKRYKYDPSIAYLVFAYYQDGIRHEGWIALEYDDPNVEHQELKKGDNGLMVEVLKQKLQSLGYDPGTVNRAFDVRTEAAVKEAQKSMELEETGIADSAFLKKLFSLP